VAALLLMASFAGPWATVGEEVKPIRALLVIGGCCHDYRRQKAILTEGISARANVVWTIVHEGDGTTTHKMSVYNNPEWSKGFDVVVHDECSADVTDREFVEGIIKPHRDGLPAVVLHCGMHCYRVPKSDEWFKFTGLTTHSHGAQLPIAITFVDPSNAITKGMENWTTIGEELYNNEKLWSTMTPLARGKQDNNDNVVVWVNEYNRKTRVFATTLGHNDETVGDPRYLNLVTRGLLWSVGKLEPRYLTASKQVLADAAPGANPALTRVNLALGKPATASASQEGHNPGDAVDGDPDTRWCAPDNGNGYWWQVDLQKPESITGCRITWEASDRPYEYKIDGSADGQTWRTLAKAAGTPRPQEDDQRFSADVVRYVRITVTKAPEGNWASFFEAEVFGKQMVAKTAAAAARDGRLTGVKAPPGFRVTKFAGPPDISYPTCLAAAPTGELFVGVDQNGSLDTKPDRGWVVRCVDTNGDGVADKFNIFAKMDSPRGLAFDHNTLYVMHPPVVEVYYDDDGDGVADRSEVLVSGVGRDLKFRGADHTSNGLRMGIDGWLYIVCGDYGAINAAGKDGRHLQLHGGGILRVRPDGSGLEIVVHGTRNMYDVAIDPLMNLLTCDNTNDGDDWNVRLSHMVPTAEYGYPSLFRHFSDEMIPTMADYGGGSPTGAIYLDEPGYPGGFGRGFYVCQWGWNSVTRHPLTASGASFTPTKGTFVEVTRPTGIAEDGSGHLYVASWKGATFTYAGPNVGFVMQMTPDGAKAQPFPDMAKLGDDELLLSLASPSAERRLHISREIVRRGAKPVFSGGLEKLAAGDASLEVRVAAIFTLKQILGANSQTALLRLARRPELREFALKALADQVADAATLPTDVFVAALRDANPRVRAQGVIALNRLGRAETSGELLARTADLDPTVSHLAFRALVDLGAAEVCLRALDGSETALVPGAARVLRNLHTTAVVDGLTQRMERDQPAAARELVLQALCRLYYREAAWDGSWWGTRPDTSGPYFRTEIWEETGKIGSALRRAVTSADPETLRFLLGQIQAVKIDDTDLTSTLIGMARSRPAQRSMIAGVFADQPKVAAAAIPLLEATVTSASDDVGLRERAFGGLERSSDQAGAADAAIRALQTLAREAGGSALGARLRNGFVRDRRHARNTGYFAKLAGAGDPFGSELGFAVLINTAAGKGDAVKPAKEAIRLGWEGARVGNLLRAIGEMKSATYRDQVEARRDDPDSTVAEAARATLELLSAAPKTEAPADSSRNIAKLGFDAARAEALKTPGDPAAGAKFFENLGCVKCHTVSKSQPLMGPFLGDIAARYGRPEIIESILRPNAQIAQGFVSNWIQTKDGQEYDGFIVRESGDQVEIRNLAGATVVAKKEILKRETRPTSIMPEGLADQLTQGDLASILAYFESLKSK
jgi:putative heme-binding domain-containing protein